MREEDNRARCSHCGAPYADGAHTAYRAPPQGQLHGSLGPTRCRRRDGHVSRVVSAQLSNGVVSISHGTPASFPLADIVDVRTDASFNGEHWGGTEFVIVRLRDHEIGLQ